MNAARRRYSRRTARDVPFYRWRRHRARLPALATRRVT